MSLLRAPLRAIREGIVKAQMQDRAAAAQPQPQAQEDPRPVAQDGAEGRAKRADLMAQQFEQREADMARRRGKALPDLRGT